MNHRATLALVVTVTGALTGALAAQHAPIQPSIARTSIEAAAHVLNRLGFGPRPGDIARVQQMGVDAYIADQLQPDQIPDAAITERLAAFPSLDMSATQLAETYFAPIQRAQQAQQGMDMRAAQSTMQGEAVYGKPVVMPEAEMRMLQQQQQTVLTNLMQQRVLRAALSERQLNEVLVDFWFNHFNVFAGKGQQEQIYLTEYERQAIRPYVLGRFRDMLGAVAHSPAMLFYLDNWQSADPNMQERPLAEQEQRIHDQPNLTDVQRLQGLLRIAQQREQIAKQPRRGINENYGRELMELHTLGVDGGYTQHDVVDVARAFTGWTIDQPQQGGGFKFDDKMHDPTEKMILGVMFPAGGGEDEGERVLDLLARHPSTAHHIALQLAQRLVSDTPPRALVDRAARTFLDTKGDLREVTRLILTSPEFFAASAVRAKVKTPFEFVVSAARASGASLENVQPIIQALRQLGEPPYGCQPPTGYSDEAGEWMNTGALLSRMNLALQLASNQMKGVRVEISTVDRPSSDDVNQIVANLFGGQISANTRQTIEKAQNLPHLWALALSSPEFQRR
jgi:uncharacterized protein (DUF1800 family)